MESKSILSSCCIVGVPFHNFGTFSDSFTIFEGKRENVSIQVLHSWANGQMDVKTGRHALMHSEFETSQE